jgi:hypothetical protein
MDPILREAVDYYIEQAGGMLQTGRVRDGGDAPVGSDTIYAELCDLRDAVEKLPAAVLYLDDPDLPYDLQAILHGMPMHAVAWRAGPANATNVQRYGYDVDQVLAKAVRLRALLQTAKERGGQRGGLHIAPPQGEIRKRMNARPKP